MTGGTYDHTREVVCAVVVRPGARGLEGLYSAYDRPVGKDAVSA